MGSEHSHLGDGSEAPSGRKEAPGRRRAALVSVALSVASTVFVVCKGLLFAPLYIGTIGATGYGNWLASGNVISMLGALEAGFGVVYMQRLAKSHGEGDAEAFASETVSGALALALASLAVILMTLAIAPFVPRWTRALPAIFVELRWAFALAGLGSGLMIFQASVDAIFGAWQRPLVAGLVRFGSRGVEVILLYATLKHGYGLLSFGIAAIASAASGTAIGWLMVGRAWQRFGLPKGRVRRVALRAYLRQTPPMLAGRTGAVLLNNNEALIISNVLSPAVATAYVLTDRVFKLGQMIVGLLGGAVFAGVAHLAGEDREGSRFRDVLADLFTFSAIGAALYCGAGAALNATFVATLVGPEYFGGQGLNALLAVACLLLVRANLVGTFLQALGWSGVVGWSSTAEIVIRVPLLIVCIRVFGIIGMPIAIIVTTVVVNLGVGTYLLATRLRRSILETALEMTARGVPSAAVALGTGVVILRLVGMHRGWHLFLLDACRAVPIVVLVVLLIFPRAREAVRRLVRGLAVMMRRLR